MKIDDIINYLCIYMFIERKDKLNIVMENKSIP
jgi:hypothetical protein